jgi:DUF3027 family protein
LATSTRARSVAPDAVCAAAVEQARAAAVEVAGGEVGEHLGFEADDERAVTHHFVCRNPAYRGWHWAVTLVRAARARVATVADTVLLPGEQAVLAPVWVPWEDRLRPGDLGPGDILPPAGDDDRLLPGWAADDVFGFDPTTTDSDVWMVAAEAGLARPRVLSPIGRDDATDRWYSGDRGPAAEIAVAAADQCSTCGFLLAMAGSMGRLFGVCANEYAPDDGRVVSFDHGCGAHSEVLAVLSGLGERHSHVLDEVGFDVIDAGVIRLERPIETADSDEDLDEFEDVAADEDIAEFEDIAADEDIAEDDEDEDADEDIAEDLEPDLYPEGIGPEGSGVVSIPGVVGTELEIEWVAQDEDASR